MASAPETTRAAWLLRALIWLLPPSPLREDLRAAEASRRRTAEIYARRDWAPSGQPPPPVDRKPRR